MFRRGEDARPGGGHERGENRPIQPAEVSMREQTSGGPEVTVVGKGARIEGNLISAGSLRIDGQIKGKITAEGDVTLSPQSEVEADIKAANVTVGGAFKGNIAAANKAELARGGQVSGNVTCKILVVAEGATFTGQSIMDGRQPGAAAESSSTEAPASGSKEESGAGDQERARR
jgi:cytoskeletal protein CcmA (bactofilin family)